MREQLLRPENITNLEKYLIEDGLIVPRPSTQLLKWGQNALSTFCHKHGVYQIPTTELIEFLRTEMRDLPTIEIGAGNGCIGRALRITMTDNMMQTWPEIKKQYALQQQPTVQYGADVKEIAAIPAVKVYHPKVVIGCWVTHLWEKGMQEGNQHGIKEELLFGHGVEKYIICGNELTHSQKPILKKFKHEVYKFPWLLSRSLQTEANVIYVIKKH